MVVKTVSIINMKGGVGKTTLTVNLSYALSKVLHKKILLIDIDPQFNATQYLVPQKEYVKYISDKTKKTVLNIFDNRPEIGPSLSQPPEQDEKETPVTLSNCTMRIYNNSGKLDLIPSTLRLIEMQEMRRGAEARLSQFINEIKDAYDYILIDCPPTMSIYTLSAYLGSDAYLIPIKPDHLSSIGFPLLSRTIGQYQKDTGKTLQHLGIVFTMVDENTTIMNETMTEYREKYKAQVFKHFIKHSTTIARAVSENLPIFDYEDSKEKHGLDIIRIAEEFVKRTGGK